MEFCSVITFRNWKTTLKTVLGILSLFAIVLILPRLVDASQTALVRASDGNVYQIRLPDINPGGNYNLGNFIDGFSIYDATGQVELCPGNDQSLTRELYTAARVLANTPRNTPLFDTSALNDALIETAEDIGVDQEGNVKVQEILGEITEEMVLDELQGRLDQLLSKTVGAPISIDLRTLEIKYKNPLEVISEHIAGNSGEPVLLAKSVEFLRRLMDAEIEYHGMMYAFSKASEYATTARSLQRLGNHRAAALWDAINAGDIVDITGVAFRIINEEPVEISDNIGVFDPLNLRLAAQVYQDHAERAGELGTDVGRNPEVLETVLIQIQPSHMIKQLLLALSSAKDVRELKDTVDQLEVQLPNDVKRKLHENIIGIYNSATSDLTAHGFCAPDLRFTAIPPTVPEGDTLTYTVALNSAPSFVAIVAISSDNPDVTVSPTSLTFTPNNWYIPKSVVVDVSSDADSRDESVSLKHIVVGYGGGMVREIRFDITDLVSNQVPRSADTIPDQTLTVGDSSDPLDLSTYFRDPNDKTLTYSVELSHPNSVLPQIIGSELTISAWNIGRTTVTVKATNTDDLFITQTFTVIVDPTTALQRPEQVGTISTQYMTLSGGARTVDVAPYFSSSNTLRYTVATSPLGFVTASISGSRVTITPLQVGSASVFVTARDSQNPDLSAIQTIPVSISHAIIVRPPSDPTFTPPSTTDPTVEGLKEGVSVITQLTAGFTLAVRPHPNTKNIPEKRIGSGVTGTIKDGPRTNDDDNFRWWYIEWDIRGLDLEGWSAEADRGQILFRRPPDLEIQDLDVSEDEVEPGDRFTVEVRVRNNGPGESAPTELSVYYSLRRHSNRAEFDADRNKYEVGTTIPIPPLRAGSRIERSLRVDAPQLPGRYYFGGYMPSNIHPTDYTRDLPSEARDNDIAPQERVEVTTAPDLIVASISSNTSILDPGETFNLAVTVRNQGIGEPEDDPTLRYYRSSNPTISDTDTEVGIASVYRWKLDTNDTERKSTSLSAPSEPGVYYYGVCIDRVENESNTRNNCSGAVAITVRELAPHLMPDLVPLTPTVSTSSLVPGESFTLETTVENRGAGDSAATPLRYYLSTDDTISDTDTQVSATILPIVAADATDELSTELTAPDTPGIYYYGVCVDAVAHETNTSNNCSTSIAITVENGVPRAVGTIPPQTLSENDPPITVDVAAYFSNSNNTTLIYIAVSDNTAVVLTQMSSSELTLTSVGAGNATVSVAVSDGALTATQTLSVSVMETRSPDLRVESVRVDKNTIDPGETFQLNAVIKNQGKADTSATPLRYYLSTDATISDTDTEVSATILPIVVVDATRELSTELTAPDTPGIYYYGACVDAVEHESDTNNNCSTAVVVTVLGADLVINSVRVEKPTAHLGEKSRLTAGIKDRGKAALSETTDQSALSTIAPGETFRFNVGIQNRGKVDSNATTLRYYLSSDNTISDADTEVHTTTLPITAANASRELSTQLTAPDTPGVYYYGVCVDGVAGETDTTNNCSIAVALTVENAGSVDLVIASINSNKTTVKPGENFQISAVVGNQGEIAATSTVLRYYFSTDEDISTADTAVHTAILPTMAANATHQQSRQFTAPATPGTYYYGVCVDTIAGESDTDNNCSMAVAVTVGGADLRIDGTPQVSKTTLSPGETFQINTRVWNQGSATSDATTLRYYLSTDETISQEDTEVASDRVAALSPKGAHASRRRTELSKTLTAPDTPGDYYYGVCVDIVAGDADTSNNCSEAVAITVEAPPPEPVVAQVTGEAQATNLADIQGPDLIISAVRVDASTIKLGGGVRFHITLTNQGTSKAPATMIRYYRSSDATISAEDTELRAVPVGELGAGRSYTTWALLPSAFSVGTYYYGACLDGVPSEFNTSNNCSEAVEIIMVLQSDPVEGLEPRGRIPPQTLKIGDSPEPLSVSLYFAGKVETWQVSSSKPAVVAVSTTADSDVVSLAPVSQGHSVVTVTAHHGDLAAKQTFDVYVGIDPTRVLRWVLPVPPQPLAVGGSPLVLDVSRHVENEVERWRAVSSHPKIVTASMSGSVVTLTPVSEGNAEVTIHASGGITEVEHTFGVFVGAAGEPDLKWVIPVPPQTLVVGDSAVTLDVLSHVAGEVETWQASSSNEAAVTVSMSGSVVTLTPVSEGSANVTISARRGDLEVSGTFTVSVGADDDLRWGVPVSSQALAVGGSPIVLNVSGHVVGEVETWQASSSNESAVTVSMSGPVVTLTPVSAGSSDVTISARRGDLEVSSTFSVSVAPDTSPLVSIPDANLRAAVRSKLGLAEGTTLTQRKMAGLVELEVSGKQITDLTGLEYATRLTKLSVSGTGQISDLSPLEELTTLTYLNFTGYSGSLISDISPLEKLTALTYLHFSGTQIRDLSPLEKLTALTGLDLRYSPFSDISPLEKLTALTSLYFESNRISDISPLEKLTALTSLTISTCPLSDLSPLENLIALTRLSLGQNQISDISPLEKLTALTHLRLWRNQISNVAPLENLTNLTSLQLSGNPIEDYAPLRRLKENNPSLSIDITIPADNNNNQGAPSARVLPAETALLSNYPNPFNPETWIPYQLATAADVTLTIYDVRGVVVRRLVLGHRPAGFYYSRGRAAHWDGRNQLGEKVASGLYFYTFTAGDFTATQKLLIRK